MAYRIANRNAELLYQTGEREFRMRIDNGVEVNVDVDAIDLVPDVELVELSTIGGVIQVNVIDYSEGKNHA